MPRFISILIAVVLFASEWGAITTAADSAAWESWLDRKLLPADEAQGMLAAFVEKQLQPLPAARTLDEWMNRREPLRSEVLRILGIDDLVPAQWDLKLTRHGTIERDGYRIERLTFESFPGFANAAVLYVPTNIQCRVPGIVSISGHTNVSKAAQHVQQRNVNLVKRGCV